MNSDLLFLIGAAAQAAVIVLSLVTIFLASRRSSKIWFAVMFAAFVITNAVDAAASVKNIVLNCAIITLIGIGWRWGDIPLRHLDQVVE